MKKTSLFILILIFILSLTAGAVEDIDFGGEIEQDVVYNQDTEQTDWLTNFSLEINKNFGFDKHLYLNPVFDYYYNEDEDSAELDLKEGYLDFYLSKADIRVGKQFVNWGTAYKINPSDMINPTDYTAEDPLDGDLAVNSASVKYYLDNNTEISGVIIGEFVPAVVSDEVNNSIISGILANFPAGKVLPVEVDEPEIDSPVEAEYALQFTRRNVNGFDLSTSYFKGYEDSANLITDLSSIPQQIADNGSATLEFGYKETQALGFNAIGSIGEIGVWTEANYAYNEDEEKTFDIVVGGDYTFKNDLYTVGQLFHRQYDDFQLERDDINYLILYGDQPFKQIHKWQVSMIYDIDNSEFLLNPEINFSMTNNIKLNLGTVVNSDFNNLSDDSLLKILGQEKTYLETVYSF